MSKFDELCAAFAAARTEWFAYRDKCQSFAGRLLGGFLKYSECPKEAAIWARLSPDGTAEPAPIFDAIKLEDDGLWHARLLLTIYEAPNIFPHQPLLIEVSFRRVGDVFSVCLGRDDQAMEIREDDPLSFDKFNHKLFAAIENFFKQSTDWEAIGANPAKSKPRRIGFRSQPSNDHS
jgi:hypothetical protein